ncbi:MAG: NUDIX hydrolase [Spirochaetaceae bacterium]|jgi:8-oxo-dGTP pyrophosphatase MutT (NUDIX family)|nr:NUDIX hydrolase [Spirochaetaceae bacterium]
MGDDKLVWRELERQIVFDTRIFSVTNRLCVSPQDERESFTVIETNDWVVVIPVLDGGDSFFMVRQWRHGVKEISLEFPGGVIESHETPLEGAERELREETGCIAGKMTKLGVMSPNPAIMANRVHFFLAEDIRVEGDLRPDKDEFISAEKISSAEVMRGIGSPPYIHALMATALCFYTRQKQQKA